MDEREREPLLPRGQKPSGKRKRIVMALGVFVTALALAVAGAALGKGGLHGEKKQKPNFVFIMTDDQDHLLNSLDYQDAVQRRLVDRGTTFDKHFCTVALCCPSRVSLLTGKAAHNTNVTDVQGPYGGYPKFIAQGLNDAYLPVWLASEGYSTYYTGKLMNQHGVNTYNAPYANGWTRSDFLIDPGTYRYLDGIMTLDNAPYRSIRGNYSTDVVADRSLEFLHDALRGDKPFFLGVTPVGPHGESSPNGFDLPIAADRHKHLFKNIKVPRSPSFNPTSPGAVSYLKTLPRLTADQIAYSDDYYRHRLQALQAVDELVDRLVATLEQHPAVLANTYIIYTSDNGYHIGQHRLPPGKTCNIEEDVNVPFVIRGPGIAAGKKVSLPTSHTDIVPTLFTLAGIPLHDDFDGVAMPLSDKDQAAPGKHEHVNIEYWGQGIVEGTVFPDISGTFTQNTYKTLRVVGAEYTFMYAVWCTNEHQLYDMAVDPHQMRNLHGTKGTTSGFDVARLTTRLDTLLLTLKSCKGNACRDPWRTVFPDGGVRSLKDAMDDKYDAFFDSQEKVTFSACANGYLTQYEGALGPAIYQGRHLTNRAEDWV